MMTIIDSNIGLINIFNQEEIDILIEKKSISLNSKILKPNTITTLNNFFDSPVEFLGMHNGYMQFKIGENKDLFEHNIWVSSFKKIDEKRFVTVYQPGTARDYNFKNGEWK